MRAVTTVGSLLAAASSISCVHAIRIEPVTASVYTGANTQLNAHVRETLIHSHVRWSIAPAGVATLAVNDRTATVLGVAAGQATVTAQAGSKTATALIDVLDVTVDSIFVTFFTDGDDKDHDTHFTNRISCPRGGTEFPYNADEVFPNNSTKGPYRFPPSSTITRGEFALCTYGIKFTHVVGQDEWKFTAQIDVYFSDGTRREFNAGSFDIHDFSDHVSPPFGNP